MIGFSGMHSENSASYRFACSIDHGTKEMPERVVFHDHSRFRS